MPDFYCPDNQSVVHVMRDDLLDQKCPHCLKPLAGHLRIEAALRVMHRSLKRIESHCAFEQHAHAYAGQKDFEQVYSRIGSIAQVALGHIEAVPELKPPTMADFDLDNLTGEQG